MFVTYEALFAFVGMLVALVLACYTIFKGNKKD